MFAMIKGFKEFLTCPEGHGDPCPEAGHSVEGDPVHQEANGHRDQGQEPEPEEQEELLVDNVVGKNTNGLTLNSLVKDMMTFHDIPGSPLFLLQSHIGKMYTRSQ